MLLEMLETSGYASTFISILNALFFILLTLAFVANVFLKRAYEYERDVDAYINRNKGRKNAKR